MRYQSIPSSWDAVAKLMLYAAIFMVLMHAILAVDTVITQLEAQFADLQRRVEALERGR